jgi:hypothetical protein
MLDRSKCKKMFVWDGDHLKERKHERIVVELVEGKGCFAVTENHESYFLNGYAFSLTHWDHYEEIPEKTKRLMTHDEIFAMIQEELKEGVLVLFKQEGSEYKWTDWSTERKISISRYTTDLGKTWHKLEVEE